MNKVDIQSPSLAGVKLPLKICFLSSMHPPRDKRVFDKEALSLAQAGFEVVHVAPDPGPSTVEQGVELITYQKPRGIWDRLMQFPRLYRLAATVNADCYHCNEPDSWVVGILLKLFRGSKVVFDVHEHYPSTFAESRFPLWAQRPVMGLMRAVFWLLSHFTDHLVFAKRTLAPDFVGFEHKQLLVQNFTPLAYKDGVSDKAEELAESLDDPQRPVTAIHLGLMARSRGWPELLQALDLVQFPDLRLHIVGAFSDGSQAEWARALEASGFVEDVVQDEWMPFEQAYQCLLAADIGLILFQPGIQNHVFALPHKLFDYMMAELPVIAPAFAQEVGPIVQEADCGLLVDPSDPEDIARALDFLAANPAERRRLGQNGRRAVLERYNWEAEVAHLINLYKEMAKLK